MQNAHPLPNHAVIESPLITVSPQMAHTYLLIVAEELASALMPALEGDARKKAFDCLKTVVRLACAIAPPPAAQQALLAQTDGADERALAEGTAAEVLNAEGVRLLDALLTAKRAPARPFSALALEAYLQRHPLGGPEVRITGSQLLTGGRQKVTILVRQEGARALPPEIVVRQDWSNSITGGTVADEYEVLVRLHRAGIKVPRPFLVERSAQATGAPFIIVSRELGATAGGDRFLILPDSTPYLLELATELGRIQAVGLKTFEDIEGLPRRSCTEQEMRDDLQEYAAGIAAAEPQPSALIGAAIAWLDANAGCVADAPIGLVHGDIGVHNILYDGNGLISLLDWELVHIGHPAADLGYVRISVQDDGVFARFVAAYRAAGGPAIAPLVIDYFAIRACVWFHYVSLKARTALISRKMTEVEVAVVLANTAPQSLGALSRAYRRVTGRSPAL